MKFRCKNFVAILIAIPSEKQMYRGSALWWVLASSSYISIQSPLYWHQRTGIKGATALQESGGGW